MDLLVYNNADSGYGSLRNTLQFNEILGGGNRIVFSNSVAGTINLSSGQLLISKDVEIAGPGANLLALNNTASSTRLFYVTNGASLTLSGLTLSGGSTVGGAAVHLDSGSLSVADCVFTGNDGKGGDGGCIEQRAGTTRVVRSAFYGNHGWLGAAVFQGSGVMGVTNCTFAFNTAEQGGGIFQNGGSLNVVNCTIVSNSAVGYGGGVGKFGGTTWLRNTILSGNTGNPELGTDAYGAFSSGGYNLIGFDYPSTGWTGPGDQVGTTNSHLYPILSPLQANGSPVPSMVPISGYSPALDRGNASGVATDQRGRPRFYTNSYVTGIPPGGDRSDIGACELSPIQLTVYNTLDSWPGSLRQIIDSAAPLDGDNIVFATNTLGTNTLYLGELVLSNKNLNILGPGPKYLALNGNTNGRVFHIFSGDVTLAGMTITGGTNNPNIAPQYGGGILNEAAGRLTISNCLITGNSAFRQGAGLANRGILSLYSSAIISNTAFGGGYSSAYGGGLYNGNYAWVQDCTFSGNTASGGFGAGGGGIYNDGTDSFGLTLYFTTIVSNRVINSGSPHGGGVWNQSGALADPIDSLIAWNTGGTSPDLMGDFEYPSFNLIGQVDGSTGITNGVNYNFAGSSAVPLDPRIGPLRDNGGPTPTHALLPDSPALDRGVVNYGGSDAFDQRGAPRYFVWLNVPHPNPTDGSDIGAFELGAPFLRIERAGTNQLVSWPGYYGDFLLQSRTNLAPATAWSAAPEPILLSGDRFVVTNASATARRFFRLQSH